RPHRRAALARTRAAHVQRPASLHRRRVRRAVTDVPTPDQLVEALRVRGVVDVRTDRALRSAYSSDASLYRVEPLAVVRPRDVDELPRILAAGAELGVPVTARGGGTSIAGNAVGAGILVD